MGTTVLPRRVDQRIYNSSRGLLQMRPNNLHDLLPPKITVFPSAGFPDAVSQQNDRVTRHETGFHVSIVVTIQIASQRVRCAVELHSHVASLVENQPRFVTGTGVHEFSGFRYQACQHQRDHVYFVRRRSDHVIGGDEQFFHPM
jgi:hypothetical protein